MKELNLKKKRSDQMIVMMMWNDRSAEEVGVKCRNRIVWHDKLKEKEKEKENGS